MIVGSTLSHDFPTYRAVQSERGGFGDGGDAFVVKLDSTGSRIEFATYLGGSGYDTALAVAVDQAGNIYVGGATQSMDFPTVHPLDHSHPYYQGTSYNDGFLTKLSPDGQEILFSSNFGGESYDAILALVVEGGGRVFVAGYSDSDDVPGLPAGLGDGFVASIDTEASRVVLSERVGGSFGQDSAQHLVWDHKRRALWVAGETSSHEFHQVRPLRERAKAENDSGFVARLVVSDESIHLRSASVLPASVAGLAVDSRGRVHVVFSLKRARYKGERTLQGWEELEGRCSNTSIYFRISPNGRRLRTVECLPTIVNEMAVDSEGRIVIFGESRWGLPLVDPIQTARDDGYGNEKWDLYVAVLAKDAVRVKFGTYFGGREQDASRGLALSRSGKRVFLTGITRSDDFPLVSPVQADKPGRSHSTRGAFVTELRPYR